MQIAKQHDTIFVYYDVVGPEWESWILLRGDAHHDSRQARNKSEKRHLEKAKRLNAGILDFGDLSDVMQTYADPRRMKGDTKEGLNKASYLNGITDGNFEFYSPYAENWILFARGNHEFSIIKYNNYDLIEELVRRLNKETGSHAQEGNFEGWVRFMFTINGTQKQSITLWYTHGAGGSAPVTRGVLKVNRRAVYLPDADIVVGAHIHTAWTMPVTRLRLSQSGKEYRDEQEHIQIPSYKVRGDWEKMKEMPPKPIGAYWLRFYREDNKIKFVTIRAKE